MKRLKISFMISILMVTLVGAINLGYIDVGKEAKAYTEEDTVFASGMDLSFIRSGTKPYGQTLLDVSVWENHGIIYPSIVGTLEYTTDGYNTSIYGVEWRAQTFTTLSSNIKIKSVEMRMCRVGLPSTLTVSIRTTDGSGHPNGSDLTSGSLDADTFTTNINGLWYKITLTPYALNANTKYAIVCRATAGNATNLVKWKIDTSGSYTDGNHESSVGGVVWSSVLLWDNTFKVHYEDFDRVPQSTWGRYGYALDFDGSDDFIRVEDDDSLDITDEITLMAWVEMDAYSASRGVIIEKSIDIYELIITPTGYPQVTLTLTNGGPTVLTGNTQLSNNTWYHLAATFDGTLISIYLNGELDTNTTISADTITTSVSPLYIGYHGIGGANYYFDGIIDEVRIYPLALTQADIKHDMFTPIQRYRTNWFKASYNEDDGWSKGLFDSDYVGFINNDPDLPYANTDGTKTHTIIESIRHIIGFQNYRFYCTLNTSEFASNEPDISWEWEFELFRNGIKETAFLINITLCGVAPERYVTVEYSQYYNNQWNLKQSENLTYAYGVWLRNVDLIVDGWVGVDRHHFSTRVSMDPENRSGGIIGTENFANPKFSTSYGFELVDNNNNPRILDWFDGFVVATLRVNNYGETHASISEHGLFHLIISIIMAVIVAGEYYHYVIKPILRETGGLGLPPIPYIPDDSADLIHGIIAAFATALKPVVDALSPIIEAIFNVVNPIIQGFINFMGDILTALINVATTLWDIIVSAIDGLLYAIFPGLGAAAFSTFLTAIVDFLVGLFTWIGNSLTHLVTFLTSAFSFFGETLTKMFNTLSTAVNQWVTMIQHIWGMLEGGYGTGANIWEMLNISTWIIIFAIFYPLLLYGIWEEKGLNAMLQHLNMVLNIFTWIFNILLTVVQGFITVVTAIIEALPGE